MQNKFVIIILSRNLELKKFFFVSTMQVYKSNSFTKLTANKQPIPSPNYGSRPHTTISEFCSLELLNLSPLSCAISLLLPIFPPVFQNDLLILLFLYQSNLGIISLATMEAVNLASYILTHPYPSLSFIPFFFFHFSQYNFLTIFG